MPSPPDRPLWIQQAIARVRTQSETFFKSALARPNFFIGTATAVLVAPLFMKNDERGYFNTSMITSPLIVAGAMVSRPVLSTTRAEASQLKGVFGAIPETFGFVKTAAANVAQEVDQIERAYAAGHFDMHERLVRLNQAHRRQADKAVDLVSERASVRSQLKRLLQDPSKKRLIENAFYRSNIEVAGATQLAVNKPLLVAPELSLRQMVTQLKSHRENPQWLRRMQFRLQQASRVNDMGMRQVFADVPIKETRPQLWDVWDAFDGFKGKGKVELKAHNREANLKPVLEELKTLVKNKTRLKAGGLTNARIQLAVIPDRNGVVQELLGLQVNYGNDQILRIPFLNKQGGVRLGEHWQNLGVSRYFYSRTEDMSAPVYAIRGLDQGREFVQEALNQAQFVVGRDVLDDAQQLYASIYGVSDATARQMAIYGHQGLPSNLEGAFLATQGRDGRWKNLRPESMVDELAYQGSQRGKIKLSGPGTSQTTLGLLESQELRHLEPRGAFSYAKESLEFKSANKTVELAGVSDEMRGFARTDALERLSGSAVPSAGIHTGQVTGSEVALFGELDDWARVEAKAQEFETYALQHGKTEELLQAWGDVASPLGLPDRPVKPDWLHPQLDGVTDWTDRLRRARDIQNEEVKHWLLKQQKGYQAYAQRTHEWNQAFLHRNSRLMAFRSLGIEDRSMQHIMAARGVGLDQARDIWHKFAPALTNQVDYEAVQQFRYLGEGSRLLAEDALGVNAHVRQIRKFTVHESALDLRGIEEGGFFKRGDMVGWQHGNVVTAEGDRNVVLNVDRNLENNTVTYIVEEQFGLGGGKTHRATKQTIAPGTRMEIIERQRGVVNRFHAAADTGVTIPRIEGWVMRQYNTDKAVVPLSVLEDMTGDLFRRLEKTKELTHVQAFMDELAQHGIDYVNGGLIDRVVAAGSSDQQLAAAADIIDRMFADVSARIAKHEIHGDSMIQAARVWMEHGKARRVDEFALQYALPETITVSDHMRIGHATQVKITRDALQQLDLAGEHLIATDITSRLVTDGDIAMTHGFMAYTDPSARAKHGFQEVFGHSLTVDQAIGSSALDLSTATGRTFMEDGKLFGTVFDPDHLHARQNYSIQLADDSYLPVLGHEAYGGKTNLYGAGEFSPNVWENELKDVLWASERYESKRGNDTLQALNAARESYLLKVRSSLGVGKDSYLRGERIDALAGEGRVTARRSTLRFADGSINPNEIGIGAEYKHLFDAKTWERLQKGGRAEAIVVRHPINAVQPVLLRYDPTLKNSDQVGFDPLIMRTARGDADGDRAAFHIVHDKAARKRVRDLVVNRDSPAHTMHEWRNYFEGAALDSTPGNAAPLNMWKLIREKFRPKGLDPIMSLRSRTAAADVGMMSNTMERLETILAHSGAFRSSAEKVTLHEFLYDIIREAPIAAQKMKAGDPNAYDMTRLMGLNNEIMSSWKNQTRSGAKRFHETILQAARDFGKRQTYDPALAAKLMPGVDLAPFVDEAGTFNPYEAFATIQKDRLLTLHGAYDVRRMGLVNKLTASEDVAQSLAKLEIASDLGLDMPGLLASTRDTVARTLGKENAAHAAAARVGSAARSGADAVLGSVEKVIKAATGHGAGKTLLIGAGIAAGAGLLFGSLRSPREGQALAPSGNRHRPEERIGVDGHIPGEPEAGTMAPATPPRTIRPAPQGVRTTMVAPVHHTTNLEVQMRAPDRGRAQDLAKHMAQMSSTGTSHVTINYRDGNRLNSLRTQEKIRETLDRD